MRRFIMRRLAESKHFVIEHEYEVVWLVLHDGRRVAIGDFYGDPDSAIIDRDEKWCAVWGLGMIVYVLREPFVPYQHGRVSPQYAEYMREKGNESYLKSAVQTGPFDLQCYTEDGTTHNIAIDTDRYADGHLGRYTPGASNDR